MTLQMVVNVYGDISRLKLHWKCDNDAIDIKTFKENNIHEILPI